MNNIISEIIFDTAYLFILIGTIAALLFSLGLIFFPVLAIKFNQRINQRFSLRKTTRTIEIAIKTEPLFYKHARLSGTLLIIGSLFILYILLTFNLRQLLPYLPHTIAANIWDWLLQSGFIFFMVFSSFIFIFGLIILIRPSQLKAFEAKANHWISTRKSLQGMSRNINQINQLVERYPRLSGSFICLFSLIVLILLFPT